MYDLIVFGGGTTGLRAAAGAASQGKRVAIIENSLVGGTCLNKGCIPSKLLICGAELIENLEKAKHFGIETKPKISFEKAMQHQRKIIEGGRRKAESNIESHKNIKLIRGRGSFLDKNTILVTKNNKKEAKTEKVKGKNIIISLGGKPFVPPIEGIEKINYLTSENVFNLKKQPKSIVLLGGGYISIEFAFFFASYGTKVTIVDRGDKILKIEDKEVAEIVEGKLKKLGVKFLYNESINKVEKKGKEISLHLNKGKLKVDSLMINTGRKPNTKSVGLENIKLKTNKRGFIDTNKYLETNVKNIYAIGDINGKQQFAHTGKIEARLAVNNIFNKKKAIDYSVCPYAVFTYPQIGAVGPTEDELLGKKIKFDKHFAPFSANGKARIIEEQDGFVKLLFSKKGKLLSARVVGPQASELIHEFILLMNSPGNHKETLSKTIHIHPTLSEVNEWLLR